MLSTVGNQIRGITVVCRLSNTRTATAQIMYGSDFEKSDSTVFVNGIWVDSDNQFDLHSVLTDSVLLDFSDTASKARSMDFLSIFVNEIQENAAKLESDFRNHIEADPKKRKHLVPPAIDSIKLLDIENPPVDMAKPLSQRITPNSPKEMHKLLETISLCQYLMEKWYEVKRERTLRNFLEQNENEQFPSCFRTHQ